MDCQESASHLQLVLDYTDRTLSLLKFETEKLGRELKKSNETVEELKLLIANEVKRYTDKRDVA